jgi:predicted DNA-binding mobile mystery protein A
MRPQDRATARRQLDKRLTPLRNSESFARPPRGWIKAIREALGMTTAQLGKRLGVSQPRAVAIEKAEVSGGIRLETLERAAHALDCRLVYALVPKNPLETTIEDRAAAVAKRRLKSTAHTMALEAQRVGEADEREQISQLAKKLAEKSGSALWEEE